MALAKDLLDILCCSFCKGDLKYEGNTLSCQTKECGLVYTVEDDIPNMLIDEAKRPCPKCNTQRDWKDDVISCAKCGASITYPRPGPR